MGKVSRVKNRIRPAIYLGAVVLLLCIIVVAFFAVKKYHRSVQARANGTVPESILATASGTVAVSDPELEPVSANKANISPEIKKKLEEAEETEIKTGDKTTAVSVDLIVFAGQSNMAGWGGDASKAPALTEGAGGEFRSVSDPSKLYTITEPFGFYENTPIMNDMFIKRGTLVTAFVNAYYARTKVPVVAVSASEGSSNSYSWRQGSANLNDAKKRAGDAITFLQNNGYIIRHKYMVWCQGESDGNSDTPISGETYKTRFGGILSEMQSVGIEKCLLCRIGENNSSDHDFTEIINAQTEMAQDNPDIVMITTALAGFKAKGLMKDDFHYYQAGYNLMGTYAGINAAYYVNTGKEPTMYDPKTDDLYYSHTD